jgi:ubiquinone biosynthesis protein COQ4
MTDLSPALKRHVSRKRRKGRDWPGAIAALRKLAADKEDTAQVYAIMHALDGHAYEIGYVRLLATPEGGRIAYERAELADILGDETVRATWPAGSVGAAYVAFQESEHISVQGLIDESHKGIPPAELDQRHPYVWFFRRFRDIHDILHVLTGYGRDWLGEVCLLAFSYQETRDLGRAVMAFGSYLRTRGPTAAQARKAIAEARRRGRAAAWLPGEDFETLLCEPLDAARRRLGLTPPAAYDAIPPDLRNVISG